MSKLAAQFPTLDEARAYRDRVVNQIKVVQGETAVSVIIDDRTLDEAKAERRAAIDAAATEATLRVADSPQAIWERKQAALAAIEAAAGNDAVDAVAF